MWIESIKFCRSGRAASRSEPPVRFLRMLFTKTTYPRRNDTDGSQGTRY
jgi:hypothetical protein